MLDTSKPLGQARVEQMLARGLEIGQGRSASYGWFRVVWIAREIGTARQADFVVSCGPEECDYITAQRLNLTQCDVENCHGDQLLFVADILPFGE